MTTPARPPPIPRRHPSRPSLSAALSTDSSSSHAGPSPDLPPLPSHTLSQVSPALPAHRDLPPPDSDQPLTRSTGTPRQHSSHSPSTAHVWMGPTHSTPASSSDIGDPSSPSAMRHTNAGLGAANVGLGPVLLDFKDWVKAGQSSRDGGSTVVAGGDRREGHPYPSDHHYERQHQQHRPQHLDLHSPHKTRNSYGSVFSSSNRSAEADYSGASVRESYSSYGGGSSEVSVSRGVCCGLAGGAHQYHLSRQAVGGTTARLTPTVHILLTTSTLPILTHSQNHPHPFPTFLQLKSIHFVAQHRFLPQSQDRWPRRLSDVGPRATTRIRRRLHPIHCNNDTTKRVARFLSRDEPHELDRKRAGKSQFAPPPAVAARLTRRSPRCGLTPGLRACPSATIGRSGRQPT